MSSEFSGRWRQLQREKLRRNQIAFCIIIAVAAAFHYVTTDLWIKEDPFLWLGIRLALIVLCCTQLVLLKKSIFPKLKYARTPAMIVCGFMMVVQIYVTGRHIEIGDAHFTISPLWPYIFLFCFTTLMAFSPFVSLAIYSVGLVIISASLSDLTAIDQISNGASLYVVTAVALVLLRSSFYAEIKTFLMQSENIQRQQFQFENEARIGRMIAQVSHDLRAPLGAFEHMVENYPDFSESTHQVMKQSVNRMASMIDALKHAEPDALIKVLPTHLDLRYFAETIAMIAEKRNIEITHNGFQGRVWLDKVMFERAIFNILINAVEAAWSTVDFEVSREGKSLHFTITDDGNGIHPSILDNVFERGATYGKNTGTGLGLYFARQVMQGHGGDIRYVRVNESSSFQCVVPNAFASEEPDLSDRPLALSTLENVATTKTFLVSLTPDTLNDAVLERLRDNKRGFVFASKYPHHRADYMITNREDDIYTSLESGIRVLDFENSADEDEIVRKVTRRFALESLPTT